MKYPVSAIVAALGCLLGPAAHAQSPAPKPANEWMKTPTDLSSADPVQPLLRQARDHVFDQFAPVEPLTPENASRTVVSIGAVLADAPEMPERPNRAVVIGTTTDYRSVLSASGRAIYTELAIKIERVFEDVSGHATAGEVLTLALSGGTVRTKDGAVISYLTQPRRYSVRPGRTYLFVLQYKSEGDFYTHVSDWDLTDGVVRPNSESDKVRASEGRSALVGLTEAQLLADLAKRFGADGRK